MVVVSVLRAFLCFYTFYLFRLKKYQSSYLTDFPLQHAQGLLKTGTLELIALSGWQAAGKVVEVSLLGSLASLRVPPHSPSCLYRHGERESQTSWWLDSTWFHGLHKTYELFSPWALNSHSSGWKVAIWRNLLDNR